MKFALNYSPQAAELIAAGQIDIDFFKTPPWPEMIAIAGRIRPVVVHFELDAGPGITFADLEEIDKILRETTTRFVNLHLDAKSKHFSDDLQKLSPQDRHSRVLERLIQDVQIVVDQFGAERVIVENVPFRGPHNNKKLAESSLPQVISAVVQTTNCGLLLDIAHARISAHTLGMEMREYLQQLPTDRLRELHITGIHVWENGRLQDHLSMLPEDWDWLSWVLARVHQDDWSKPHMLAFEYGGTGPFFGKHCDPRVLAEQVPRLAALVRGDVTF